MKPEAPLRFPAPHRPVPVGWIFIRVEWLTREASTTSAIEGEMLDRDSIQDSLMRRLGLRRNSRRHGKEEGVAEMMVSLYRYFDRPLDQETLFGWHRMLMSGRRDLDVVGGYRENEDDMLIVSGGPIGSETIHYQAPPAQDVPEEMRQFVEWFNRATATRPAKSILAVTAATHARFESIHPFEDGNGRIGRAIAEKAMARMIGRPTMLPLAAQIEQSRKALWKRPKLRAGGPRRQYDQMGQVVRPNCLGCPRSW